MTRLIILAVLAVTLAFVFADDDCGSEYATYVSMSGRVEIPKVKIPWRQIPKDFQASENQFLDKCRVTETYVDPEDMEYDDNSEAMIKINTIVKRINRISDNFTTGLENGKYNNFESDKSTFKVFAAELLKIDQDLNASGKENHEGPLILAVCMDMYSILSFMAATQKPSPAKPSQNQEDTVKALLEQRKYFEAKTKITEILKTTPVKSDVVSELLLDRAIANSETRFYREAIEDATNAMKDSRLHSKCLEIRAKCYMSMRKFQDAVTDYEALLNVEKSSEVEQRLAEAKQALQRAHSANYYDVLEIETTASSAEIKRAYRRLALIHHPDKHADAPENEQIKQKELFEKINTAYATLSDPTKRRVYDRDNGNWNRKI